MALSRTTRKQAVDEIAAVQPKGTKKPRQTARKKLSDLIAEIKSHRSENLSVMRSLKKLSTDSDQTAALLREGHRRLSVSMMQAGLGIKKSTANKIYRELFE